MQAHLTVVRNPFDPAASRFVAGVRKRVKVRALVPRNRPAIALLNGRPLLRAGWRRRLADGDHLVVVVLPRGGGGKGGGGSNPLRLILTLALMIFAPWAAGFIAAKGTVLHSLVTLGITLAGQALLNRLLPVRQPEPLPNASPTYTLQAQANQARLEQAIPVQYGRMKSYPDLAAQPYAEFAGNEQYLFQLLCLGVGEYDIESILIEDTPITSFSEIEAEIVPPGEQVTMFPTAVVSSVEVSGQEMDGRASGTWARSGTTVTITEADHLRAVGQGVHLTFGGSPSPDTGVYAIATVGDGTWTVQTETGTGSGSVTIRSVVGGVTGFVANPAGTVANRLSFDAIMPRGLYKVEDDELADMSLQWRLQVQRIDDDGDPIGIWQTLERPEVTDRTVTPIRRSYFYDLTTPGRYRARAWRIDQKVDEGNVGHDLLWGGLRAYLVAEQDFGPVTLVAMRMRASNNLSMQASRRVGIIATRKLPIWDGEDWTAPQPTASIAWALADAARNPDFGGRLPDWRLDLPALAALDAVWTERGDEFNGRFDQSTTWWDAATRITRAGRARPFFQGGILRVVRDAPATVPVALFSMRNIKGGSFSVDYIMSAEETADAVEVSYWDRKVWAPRRIKVALPGSTAERPARVDLFGVTDRAHARREAFYIAAANKFRRRTVRFSTEMEGFIPILGDLIAIQHDMPGWGQVAEAVAWNPTTRALTLDQPLDWSGSGHQIGLRNATGGAMGPYAVTRGGDDRIAILPEVPPEPLRLGADGERTHAAFGRATTWAEMARVVDVRPRNLYEVEIEAVIEHPTVHTADLTPEGGDMANLPVQLPVRNPAPVVTGLLAAAARDATDRIVLSWNSAPGADSYHVEMAEGDDYSDQTIGWTRVADTTSTSVAVAMIHPSRVLIRVRGMGLLAGPWVYASAGQLLGLMWTATDPLMWGVDTDPMWS